MAIIPFYGAQRPELFSIERAAMDRSGKVIAALDRHLQGRERILDVGAGDGFTAQRLQVGQRRIVALEPAPGMIRPALQLRWVRGDAERLPFADGMFDAAYATWAYFFPSLHDISPGLAELDRVVSPGGPIAVVNNLGGDEFSALSDRDITEPQQAFERFGFEMERIETHFDFRDLDSARLLLGFYFGERGERAARLRLTYNVGLYHRPAGR